MRLPVSLLYLIISAASIYATIEEAPTQETEDFFQFKPSTPVARPEAQYGYIKFRPKGSKNEYYMRLKETVGIEPISRIDSATVFILPNVSANSDAKSIETGTSMFGHLGLVVPEGKSFDPEVPISYGILTDMRKAARGSLGLLESVGQNTPFNHFPKWRAQSSIWSYSAPSYNISATWLDLKRVRGSATLLKCKTISIFICGTAGVVYVTPDIERFKSRYSEKCGFIEEGTLRLARTY